MVWGTDVLQNYCNTWNQWIQILQYCAGLSFWISCPQKYAAYWLNPWHRSRNSRPHSGGRFTSTSLDGNDSILPTSSCCSDRLKCRATWVISRHKVNCHNTTSAELNAVNKSFKSTHCPVHKTQSATPFTLCKYHSRFGADARRCEGSITTPEKTGSAELYTCSSPCIFSWC